MCSTLLLLNIIPQLNMAQEKLHFTHPTQKFPQPPNPLVKPPPVAPPQQLFNPQPPVIAPPISASKKTHLPVTNVPQQNIVHSPQARVITCRTAQKRPLNCNLDLTLWSFLQNNPPNIKQATRKSSVFNNFQPAPPTHSAISALSRPNPQLAAPQNVNSNHALSV